jgi:hypothetical protein
MKQKFLLSALFVCMFFVSTQAQIGKGSAWLGGNIGYSQSKSDYVNSPDQKTEVLQFSPSVGTAIKENLIAGISLGYTENTQKNTNPNGNYAKTTSKYYGGGIFIRRYIPVVTRLYLIGEATAYYNSGKITTTEVYSTVNSKVTTKSWNTSLSFTPGISYGLTKKVQLETGFNSLFAVGYGKSKRNLTGSSKETSESFSAGINLENKSTFYIGFRFLINTKA